MDHSCPLEGLGDTDSAMAMHKTNVTNFSNESVDQQSECEVQKRSDAENNSSDDGQDKGNENVHNITCNQEHEEYTYNEKNNGTESASQEGYGNNNQGAVSQNLERITMEGSQNIHVLVVAHGSPIRELVHHLADDLKCELPGGRETIAKTHNTCVSQFTVYMSAPPKITRTNTTEHIVDCSETAYIGAEGSCHSSIDNEDPKSSLQQPGNGTGKQEKCLNLGYSVSKVTCSLLNDKSHLGTIASTY